MKVLVTGSNGFIAKNLIQFLSEKTEVEVLKVHRESSEQELKESILAADWIVLTGSKLGNDARERIRIMTSTNNGFEIAEKDLELRGPGDIEGTKQSGVLNFKLASIVQDRPILELARNMVSEMVENDPDLNSAENLQTKVFLQRQKGHITWSKIS